MQGSCLCGEIVFEIDEPIPNVYLCHCSLCRKATGASSNTALIIPASQFRWIKGEDAIQRFELASGYGNEFCRHCGSPVPGAAKQEASYWVPAGLLDGRPNIKVARHIYVGSKAPWDEIGGDAPQYETRPPEA